MHSDSEHKVEEVGNQTLKRVPVAELSAGEVGYVLAGMKSLAGLAIGDTLTEADRPAAEPVPGYREAKPVVFSSIYPMATDDYEDLTKALEKLKLNDASLIYEKDSSAALGFGFRCGFLGLLHLDVVQERLEREYDLSLILSAPSVRYRIVLNDDKEVWIDNPTFYPDPAQIKEAYEPYIKASIMIPERYLGTVMELCRERRGVETTYNYLAAGRMEVTSQLPLAEVLFDFYDRLKSITQGYGSFDYEMLDYRLGDMVKVDILVNGEKVDALSQLVHREFSRPRALRYCERLAKKIPRQQFKIAIQGAIGGQIIARSTINPFRKDVTAKCYGGDISRKRKLLEKQKEGKKKMKMVGNVEIPQSAFVSVLKTEDDERRRVRARALPPRSLLLVDLPVLRLLGDARGVPGPPALRRRAWWRRWRWPRPSGATRGPSTPCTSAAERPRSSRPRSSGACSTRAARISTFETPAPGSSSRPTPRT